MTIDDIRLEIDASRRAIRNDYSALRAELDFAAKTKRAVVEHPLPWLGGAAFLGFLLSGRRRRKERKRKGEKSARGITIFGVLLTIVRLIFPFVQPHLTTFATHKLANLAGRFQR